MTSTMKGFQHSLKHANTIHNWTLRDFQEFGTSTKGVSLNFTIPCRPDDPDAFDSRSHMLIRKMKDPSPPTVGGKPVIVKIISFYFFKSILYLFDAHSNCYKILQRNVHPSAKLHSTSCISVDCAKHFMLERHVLELS